MAASLAGRRRGPRPNEPSRAVAAARRQPCALAIAEEIVTSPGPAAEGGLHGGPSRVGDGDRRTGAGLADTATTPRRGKARGHWPLVCGFLSALVLVARRTMPGVMMGQQTLSLAALSVSTPPPRPSTTIGGGPSGADRCQGLIGAARCSLDLPDTSLVVRPEHSPTDDPLSERQHALSTDMESATRLCSPRRYLAAPVTFLVDG